MTPSRAGIALHVLDDDPTGVQAAADVPVVTSWLGAEPTAIPDAPVVYHLTNTRSLSPQGARSLVATVARHVGLRALNGATPRFVLRGDSTLRGHVYEEFDGLVSAVPARPNTLVLVPAMPDAGRVTRNGVHLALDASNGVYVPVAETEYGQDPRLGYSNSRLVDWAEERSQGQLRADRSVEVHLDPLRGRGSEAVTAALSSVAGLKRSVVAIDAETEEDLTTIARGLHEAFRADLPIVVRAAPPLAALLGSCRAQRFEPVPHVRRVLVVCGSFVPLATRQLEVLARSHPGSTLTVGIDQLMAIDAGSTSHLAAAISGLRSIWRRCPVAVLATPRTSPSATSDFSDSTSVARGLAAVVRALETRPDLVISKGGSTSAHVVRIGLGADTATVVGPVARGISLWRVEGDSSLVIVPGNVGTDSVLDDLVNAALGSGDGLIQ